MNNKRVQIIEEAIDDIRKGKIIIVCDDEQRENEGDFIAAAEMVTPDIINFMATYGRGLICAALTKERCAELELSPMIKKNTALNTTNFTVSVDLLGYGCTTGISASDRAKTINALANPNTRPEELGRPGHVFPITADGNGIKHRQGHTEVSVLLPKLAGLKPAGALVEIMNTDGTMARYPDLVEIANVHQLKLITIKEVIDYLDYKNISH
ncbi:MAG: 3,4-dihydroxy-2-butanone-4-phosphate synthase [Bacteroidales bacterium]|nr:3,4-dihydroxy-2-butanone-4-phosphate synthase [Bacteroidales bacterium]MBN2820901.1 3,4-dihydroxy-2-butanone-4-phosphate synthase [Bacteroidales bacterium]